MIILIKGAGDLATGIAHRLKVCGFDVIMTEISMPTTVRRTVAFSQAVFDGIA
ncbi:MAG: selenium-dependent molybdenum cofactor biosynthesis protein YqeB, partial [Clostridium butyricum]